EEALTARGTGSRRLRTSHAFHSAMVDPVIEPLAEILRQIPLSVPRVPYVSTMTGRWITADQAADPLYWARHCRETVRYAAALESLARQSKISRAVPLITASLPDPAEKNDGDAVFLDTLGRLWAAGMAPD